MEQFLDSRTLAFISGSILLVLCFIMLTEYFFRKVYSGFTEWVAANILMGIGLFLLGMRGMLGSFFTILAANALIVAYFQLLAHGLAKFYSLKLSYHLDLLIDAVYLISFSYFTYLSPDIVARIVILSALMSLISMRCIWVIKRGSRSAKFSVSRLLIWTFYMVAGWFSLRILLYTVGEKTIVDTMSANAIDVFTYTLGIFSYIIITTGLIQLNTSRIERELLDAQEEIRTIKGFLPICAYCKKIRDDDGYWNQLEAYISSRTDARFSHGICPECLKKHFPDEQTER